MISEVSNSEVWLTLRICSKSQNTAVMTTKSRFPCAQQHRCLLYPWACACRRTAMVFHHCPHSCLPQITEHLLPSTVSTMRSKSNIAWPPSSLPYGKDKSQVYQSCTMLCSLNWIFFFFNHIPFYPTTFLHSPRYTEDLPGLKENCCKGIRGGDVNSYL